MTCIVCTLDHVDWVRWNQFLTQILSYNHNKIIFDSISEGEQKLQSYLFIIFCWFHVNNDDIPMVMQHTCMIIYSHSIEADAEERLTRIGYFET